jgi:hypothetical protein
MIYLVWRSDEGRVKEEIFGSAVTYRRVFVHFSNQINAYFKVSCCVTVEMYYITATDIVENKVGLQEN